jgi:hypothetical protein
MHRALKVRWMQGCYAEINRRLETKQTSVTEYLLEIRKFYFPDKATNNRGQWLNHWPRLFV